MCEQLINFINPNQHIVTTKQSEMGSKCNLIKILKEILELKNFTNYIIEDDTYSINSKLHDMICSKKESLKR